MVKSLTIVEMHDFIKSDFTGAWDSVAANHDKTIGRGNFMFAREAMNLLEYVCRLYGGDGRLSQILKGVKNYRTKILHQASVALCQCE